MAAANVELYPMFTVDFDERHKPASKYMMASTIRDIVKLAIHSPRVQLKTSAENLKHVWAIEHPHKANKEKRDAAPRKGSVNVLQQPTVTATAVPTSSTKVRVDSAYANDEDECRDYFTGDGKVYSDIDDDSDIDNDSDADIEKTHAE